MGISAAIFTLDEEVNLPYCLDALRECDDIVVIDSYSSDRTVAIAQARGARVFQHPFTGFGDQRMWALNEVNFKQEWVLILDADERVTPQLWREMIQKTSVATPEVGAYRLKRRFYWEGKWLRYANLYPSWVVRLVRRGCVQYHNRGHAETQEVQGETASLEADLLDENHKGLEAWRVRQRKYAEEEARYEAMTSRGISLSSLRSSDPLERRAACKQLAQRLPFRGVCYFLYAYFLRRGFLDGWTGLRFCWEKAKFQSFIASRARYFAISGR